MGKNQRKRHVVIIGGGIAGFRTADMLRAMDSSSEISVFTKAKNGEYSTCGIPFVIGGRLNDFNAILLHTVGDFAKRQIRVIEAEVKEISLQKGFVRDERGCRTEYDVLVLATGRYPVVPPIPGLGLKGVYTISHIEEAERAYAYLKAAARILVVGGGAIGVETAAALGKRAEVTVVEMLPHLLPASLDPDMAGPLESYLRRRKIHVFTSTRIKAVHGPRRVKSVSIEPSDGAEKRMSVDMVIMSTGIRPEITLAREAGFDMGPTGGIKTTSTLNVKQAGRIIDHVFALGDCAELKEAGTGEPILSPLASNAARQAYVVAKNILHPGSMRVQPTCSPRVSVAGRLQIGSAGLTEGRAAQVGLKVHCARTQGWSRSRYFPGRKLIRVKLVARGNRLVGAQFLGEEDIKERVNLVALAIQEEIPIPALAVSERAFAPPLSLLTDPMVPALRKLMHRES